MISFKELIGDILINDIDIETQHNLEDLLKKINIVRTAWDKPMIVTSGLRTMQDQLRINPKAPKSKHMTGQAVDIYDPDGFLKEWVKKNIAMMEAIGFWFEDFAYTKTWVHFQTQAPLSGRRFFIP